MYDKCTGTHSCTLNSNRTISFCHFRSLSGVIKNVLVAVQSSLPLWILGVGRVISVKGTDYHEHVAEYGVHWNFFFTLAVVKVLTSSILYNHDNLFYHILLGSVPQKISIKSQ